MTITAGPPAPAARFPRRAMWLQTPAAKAMMIIALALGLLIPLYLVDQVNRDRAAHQEEARLEYQKSWGPSQSVIGPILAVPYTTPADGVRHYLNIAPHRLVVTSRLQPELRRRGLFRAIVYQAHVELSGEFTLAHYALPVPADAHLYWESAQILLGATDLRALEPDPSISWNGRKLPFNDAIGNVDQLNCGGYALLSAVPSFGDAPVPAGTVPFSTALDLRGTGPLRINPLGRQVELSVSSPWSTPGFSGVALPSQYRVGAGGFAADWTITSNPTTGPWIWTSSNTPSCSNSVISVPEMSRQVGVELLDAMPIYHMTERASKYAMLFLALTFLTYFLFEMVARVMIHMVQYGLLGLSITLFGLLLISFSEPLGFTPPTR